MPEEVFILLDSKATSFHKQECVCSPIVPSADIGACESIMKKKTKQDFQELIKTEHGDLAASPASALGLPAPARPEDMFCGTFQLMVAMWNAGSC